MCGCLLNEFFDCFDDEKLVGCGVFMKFFEHGSCDDVGVVFVVLCFID